MAIDFSFIGREAEQRPNASGALLDGLSKGLGLSATLQQLQSNEQMRRMREQEMQKGQLDLNRAQLEASKAAEVQGVMRQKGGVIDDSTIAQVAQADPQQAHVLQSIRSSQDNQKLQQQQAELQGMEAAQNMYDRAQQNQRAQESHNMQMTKEAVDVGHQKAALIGSSATAALTYDSPGKQFAAFSAELDNRVTEGAISKDHAANLRRMLGAVPPEDIKATLQRYEASGMSSRDYLGLGIRQQRADEAAAKAPKAAKAPPPFKSATVNDKDIAAVTNVIRGDPTYNAGLMSGDYKKSYAAALTQAAHDMAALTNYAGGQGTPSMFIPELNDTLKKYVSNGVLSPHLDTVGFQKEINARMNAIRKQTASAQPQDGESIKVPESAQPQAQAGIPENVIRAYKAKGWDDAKIKAAYAKYQSSQQR